MSWRSITQLIDFAARSAHKLLKRHSGSSAFRAWSGYCSSPTFAGFMMTKALTNFCIFSLNCFSAVRKKAQQSTRLAPVAMNVARLALLLQKFAGSASLVTLITPLEFYYQAPTTSCLSPFLFLKFLSESGSSWTFTFSSFPPLSTSTSADSLLLWLAFSFPLHFFFFSLPLHDEEMLSRWTPN
ncbi:uncharacterized protein J3D65DRAFT_69153 [Phyllosticta citribraziliensis]|uniref:Uncharacterized protein n=1 Tax=Phyllosticta citribraziliensis TaxID=989973 RepID=A0ABR1LCW7_9PEZI